VAFELDSPERESGEGSTTPCGVKGVVGPGSRAQIRLAVEKTECQLQRTTTHIRAVRSHKQLKENRGYPVRISTITQNIHGVDYFNAHGTTIPS